MIRQEFSRRTKLQAWDRCKNACEECGGTLRGSGYVGGIEYDHRIPAELGGDNSLENCAVLCKSCHDAKTHQRDAPAIAKSRAVRARHIGAHRSRSPIKGWRKFDGTPVRNPRLS